MNRNPIVALILCAALAGCANPAATSTPRAPATAAATNPTGTATAALPEATVAVAPTSSATPAQAPTPNPAVVRGQAWVPPGVDSSIVVYARSFEYAPASRPAGMDDPALGCDSFDEGQRVILLTANLRIYNRSDQPLRDWYAYFSAPSGEALFTCHQGFERMPELPPGHYVDVTFGAFSEGMVRMRGYVYDRAVGRSNEVEF